jgi:uncharacterized protein YjbI with pentapeptide repeats
MKLLVLTFFLILNAGHAQDFNLMYEASLTIDGNEEVVEIEGVNVGKLVVTNPALKKIILKNSKVFFLELGHLQSEIALELEGSEVSEILGCHKDRQITVKVHGHSSVYPSNLAEACSSKNFKSIEIDLSSKWQLMTIEDSLRIGVKIEDRNFYYFNAKSERCLNQAGEEGFNLQSRECSRSRGDIVEVSKYFDISYDFGISYDLVNFQHPAGNGYSFPQGRMNYPKFKDQVLTEIITKSTTVFRAVFQDVQITDSRFKITKFVSNLFEDTLFQKTVFSNESTIENSEFRSSVFRDTILNDLKLIGTRFTNSLLHAKFAFETVIEDSYFDSSDLTIDELSGKVEIIGTTFSGANLYFPDVNELIIRDSTFIGSKVTFNKVKGQVTFINVKLQDTTVNKLDSLANIQGL